MTDVTPEAAPETQGAPETQETQGPDITQQLSERFDQLSGQMEQLTQGWQQFQDAAYEPEDPYAQDPYGQQQQQYEQQQPQVDLSDPQQLAQFIDQRAQQIAQQQTAPIQQQFVAQRIEALAGKYPEMRDPEVLKQLDQTTGQIAQAYGNPALATDPAIVEMAMKAYKADQFAAQQQPISQVQEGQAHLEGAGASPQQPEQDPMDTYFPADQQRRSDSPFGF